MSPKRPAPDDGVALVPASKRLNADAAAAQEQDGGIVVFSGGGGCVATTTPTVGKRQLRPSMLVLFFVAQVKEELRYNRRLRRVIREENAISQKRTLEVFQKSLDNACQSLVNHINCSLQSLTNRTDILCHEVEQLKRSNFNQRSRSEANQEHAAVIDEVNQEQTGVRFATCESQGQVFQLRFLNKLNPLVYTKDKITAEDGAAIKIAIFQNNQIVKSGPLSSARIEILALEGDFINVVPDNWTECQFDRRIASFPQGPVLGGLCQIKLQNGEASSSEISFNVPSSKTASGKFILAARVHSSDKPGFRIMEALMNPVVVQVYRNKLNRNSDCPKLKDEVHRLKGISRNGCRAKWLKDNQINTVEEFIKALNKDEEKIRNECFKLKKGNKDWKDTVKHARECDLEGNCKLKSFRVEEEHIELFFDCVHNLIGAQFRECYVAKDDFSSVQQDEVSCLKKQAYDRLDKTKFDHEMKDNYPVPLSSAMNTSIGGGASIPFRDITGPNPPHFYVAYQGNQAGDVTQMGLQHSQVGISSMGQASEPPLEIPESTPTGVNNTIPTNVPQDVSDEIYAELFAIVNYARLNP